MKLIPDWRRAWRMFSVQALAVVAALQAMLAGFPPDWLALDIPALPFTLGQVLVACTVVAAVLGFLGRLIDQPALEQP